MSNWRYSIDIKKEWNDCKNGVTIPQKMAAVIILKLKELSIFGNDNELKRIVKAFESVSQMKECAVVEEFNDVMECSVVEKFDDALEMLYNWGDQEVPSYTSKSFPNKKCWIGTF